jgi:hypothetical protein
MPIQKLSNIRQVVGTILLILAGVGLFIPFVQVAMTAVLSRELLAPPLLASSVVSIAILVAASYVVRTKSVLWQIPLQAFAVACEVVGAVVIVTILFENWQLLFGAFGAKASVCLAVGLAAGWLMRLLQARLIPEQDA